MAELHPLIVKMAIIDLVNSVGFLIFCWIFMKLADNNGMLKISDEFENRSDWTDDGKVMSP